ncbi:hypothetical protein [Pseudomonas gingeri]|uniref:Uncharacterized protein n=1 Tax=Pseudomonas gingeri TaxID=117681 RepID=A0A7Y7WJ77_9PSED|nr:hypothetical protein [Pseudomonas gingeri]NWB50342.1 hypothetical protein [Pseudomonas gingeri]
MNNRLKFPATSLMMIGALSASVLLTPAQAATLQTVGPTTVTASSLAQSVNSTGKLWGPSAPIPPAGPIAPGSIQVSR